VLWSTIVAALARARQVGAFFAAIGKRIFGARRQRIDHCLDEVCRICTVDKLELNDWACDRKLTSAVFRLSAAV
jgi:hypothetical protein